MKRPRLKLVAPVRPTRIQFEIRPSNKMFGVNKQAWVDLWHQGLQGTMVTFKTKAEADRRFKRLPKELRERCKVFGLKYYV